MINNKSICSITSTIFLMLLIGCSFAATDEATPYPVASASGVHSGIVTTVLTATPEEEVAPSPTAQATPTALFVASPTVIPTAINTIPAPSTITPTIVSDCENNLEPVQEIDPNWSAIIEQVNKLQGFFTLTISADGQYFAVLEADNDKPGQGYIYLWEVNTGKLLWSIASKEPISIAGIAFSPDGTLLATGATGIDQHVFVWDVASGELVHKFRYTANTTEMSFSSDNKFLAVGGIIPEGTAIWNLEEGSETGFSIGNGAVFVPTSTEPLLVVYKIFRFGDGPTSPIQLFNLSSGQQEYLFYSGANRSSGVGGVAISSDGRFVSTVNYFFSDEKKLEDNITLKVFDLVEQKDIPFEEINLRFTHTSQMGFSSAGHVGVLHGSLYIWDPSGKFISCLNNPSPISGFVFTPDGSHLLTYSGYKAPLSIWKLPTP